MNESNFFIIGPLNDSEEPTFWNIDEGWTDNFDKATPFSGDILTDPLPKGTTCIIPFSKEGQPLAQFGPLTGSRGNQNFFEKSY